MNPFEPPNLKEEEIDYSTLIAIALAVIIGICIIIRG